MKKHIFKNRGFTLVECIVAIAAFAILTTMVLMIMAGTTTTQQKSSKAAADLDQLVENVVRDDSKAKLDEDTTKTLKMSVAGKTTNFSMTYNSISGYKNYVVCPNCGKMLNNIDFMTCVYDPTKTAYARYLADIAAFSDHKGFKACYWFDPTKGDQYTCPDCGHEFSAYTDLYCEDCEIGKPTGSVMSGSDFGYDNNTGSFFCLKCGSSRVTNKNVKDEITTDSPFSVGSMQPNAIRYGKVEKPSAEDNKSAMGLVGPDSTNFTASLKFTPSTNTKLSLPGTYKLLISGYNLADKTGEITIQLPPCYECKIVKTSEGCDGKEVAPGRMHATVTVTPPDDYAKYDKNSVMKITGITTTDTGSSFWIEFQLTNYKNSADFDEDYKTDGGLSKWWFGYTDSCYNAEKTKTYTGS